MAAVVCVDSTSFSFMERFRNASVLNPPTKYPERSFVQILLYRRPKKHSCDKSMDRQCTYQHCRNSLQLSWQLSFLLFFTCYSFIDKFKNAFVSRFFGCRFQFLILPIWPPSEVSSRCFSHSLPFSCPGCKEWVRRCRCSCGCCSPCTCIWSSPEDVQIANLMDSKITYVGNVVVSSLV